MRRRLGALALLIIAPLSAPLCAQQPVLWRELVPGERVRIDAPGLLEGRLSTMVVARSGDSVRVRGRQHRPTAPGEERLDYLTLPLAGITTVEVSQGRSHLVGAMIGAMSGTAVTMALVTLGNRSPQVCPPDDCPKKTPTKNLIIGAEVGAVVGGLFGLVIGREQWKKVDVASQVSFLPGAARGALALRAQF